MPSCSAETHLFSSHPTTDASEASVSRAWGPCRPVSPKYSIKASHETRNRPEECLGSAMAGRPRALFVTKRHKTSRFGHLFLLAISEIGCTYQKKVPHWSPVYVNETKTPTNFLPHKCPWSRDQKPRPGVSPPGASLAVARSSLLPTCSTPASSQAGCIDINYRPAFCLVVARPPIILARCCASVGTEEAAILEHAGRVCVAPF